MAQIACDHRNRVGTTHPGTVCGNRDPATYDKAFNQELRVPFRRILS